MTLHVYAGQGPPACFQPYCLLSFQNLPPLSQHPQHPQPSSPHSLQPGWLCLPASRAGNLGRGEPRLPEQYLEGLPANANMDGSLWRDHLRPGDPRLRPSGCPPGLSPQLVKGQARAWVRNRRGLSPPLFCPRRAGIHHSG